MDGLIFRVDDVSPNTDMADLNESAKFLYETFGGKIWYCVNLFSRESEYGSVYPNLPMRGRGFEYFCDVDRLLDSSDIPGFVDVVSHGLLHAEHGEMDRQAQYLSIMTSCNYLNTRIFVPPFMSYNRVTSEICSDNGIELIDGNGWKSMETEPCDLFSKLWYFHPWRMNYSRIKEWVNACKVHV